MQGDYADAIGSGDQIKIIQAKSNLQEAAARAQELHRQLDYLSEGVKRFGVASRDAFESSLGKGLDDAIWGVGKLSDVALGFLHDLTREFSSMASRNFMQAIFGDLLTTNQNGSTNTSLASAGGLVGRLFGPSTTPGTGQYGASAAQSAAINSDLASFGFADGGVVTRKTHAWLSERGQPEAVVPLSGGRSIPVQMSGGGGEPPKVFVIMDPNRLWQLGYNANKDQVIDGVSGNIMKGGKIAKLSRRRPG
jgi:hypothetical protein